MRLYKVEGNSMYPLLRDSDMVVVSPVPVERLKKGTIVVFEETKGEYIVHRLVKKTGDGKVILRGDGYNLPLESAAADAVVGRATGIIRGGRLIRISRTRECCFWAVARIKEQVKRLLKERTRIVRQGKMSVSDHP
ncbi:MAG: S24/S26 family peptidase [Deltaproteobacteria bacterium]|nr:S24/S26 family peptidase [Deltaproteobacteria bacterium]